MGLLRCSSRYGKWFAIAARGVWVWVWIWIPGFFLLLLPSFFPLYQVSAVDKQRKFYPFSFRSDPSLARAVRTSHEVSLDGFPDLNLSIARECVELRQRSGCQEGCNAMDTLVCGWGCPRSEVGK